MVDLPHVTTNDPHPDAHNVERDAINELQNQMSSKIDKPGATATGDLLRWDGTRWVSTQTRFFEGTGNPNGQIAAPVGSRYVDMAGTRGAVTWDKTSGGDSNTGWTSSIGPLALNGQKGTSTATGAAAKTKSVVVPLNADIFLGVAPSQILLTPYGGYGSIANPYVSTKSSTSFTIVARHVDNVNFTSTQNPVINWIALI